MVQIFSYNDQSVSFKEVNGSVFVNATTMAKSFGKQPSDWLRLKSTSDFMDAVYTSKGYNPVQGIPRMADSEPFTDVVNLVHIVQGGNNLQNTGTWMHEDVALEFARWLSPAFAIWCNDRIKELLRHGFTATDSTIEDMINNPDLLIGLATQLKEERAAKQLLEQQFQLQSDEIEKAATKVQYHDQVLQSVELIPINVIAKELGLSAVTLNKILNSLGVIYRSGETWVLYSRFQNRGIRAPRPPPTPTASATAAPPSIPTGPRRAACSSIRSWRPTARTSPPRRLRQQRYRSTSKTTVILL